MILYFFFRCEYLEINESINFTNELNKLIEDANCHKDFFCIKLDIDNFDRLNRIVNTSLLECSSEDSSICKKSFNYGDSHFCKCPIIKYIIKS